MMIMRFPGGLRKALTLSYDDGVEQDQRLIEIMNKHGLKGAFNLNSGLFAPEGVTYPAGTIHRRLPASKVKALYGSSGQEVAVHCLTHASLTELTQSQIVWEVMQDRANLEHMFGGVITGMAYPFGTFQDSAVEALKVCGIQYARTVISSHRFDLPEDWLRLAATCHHNDPQLFTLCDLFLAEPAPFASKLFYLWGHAYEFEADDNWHVIEQFAEKMGGRSDIWYATNIDIVDYVTAFKQLVFSADGSLVYNPTCREFWFDYHDKAFHIRSGETLQL